NQNFASLLQKQSGIFIRSNGRSGLNTASYKGMGTAQTPIVLNGANMQSTMNGTIDLSLLDPIHFSSTTISSAESSTTGMNNMGETISLNSKSPKRALSLNASLSSLMEKALSAKFSKTNYKWSYGISAIGVQSDNVVNLSHYDIDSNQQNTDFQKFSLMQTVGYKSSSFGSWTNTIYIQSSERGIPRKLYDLNVSRQEDRNFMMLNQYKKQFRNKLVLEVSNQIWQEQIIFDNIVRGQITNNLVNSVNSNVSLCKLLKDGSKAKLGLTNEQSYFSSEAIRNRVELNRGRGYVSFNKPINRYRFKVDLGARPYLSNVKLDGKISGVAVLKKGYRTEFNVQKVYRLPVLNELYWYEPGYALGNVNLKPEEGYKVDLKVSRAANKLQLLLNPHAGMYSNWIEWGGVPVTSPKNIKDVLVIGTEVQASFEKEFKVNKLVSQMNYHWVRAVYQYEDTSDPRHGKQTLYTPQHTANVTLTYISKNYGVYFNEQFVGRNYFTSDNSAYLDAYLLSELGGYYQLKKWRIGATASNLFDTPYFTQPNSPLPGRVFKINVNYTIPIKPWKEK
ncbi:MAG: TonB-dependent receptor plug domain-containing protein, partial [Bacteroidia bacterium]